MNQIITVTLATVFLALPYTIFINCKRGILKFSKLKKNGTAIFAILLKHLFKKSSLPLM